MSATFAVLLYVEDEPLIREVVETGLRDAGFEVITAPNGAEALKILDGGVEGLRGLITDVNLGAGVEGWEVARHARELNPALPVVFVSGGSEHEWTAKGVPHSVMVAKPFAPAQIVVAVSTLLVATDAKL